MQKMFHHILVPVTFNKKTDIIIKKAIAFANQLDCHLHLLHINQQSFLATIHNFLSDKETRGRVDATKQFRMFALQKKYQGQMKDGLKLFTAFQKGSREELIEKYAETQSVDMILLDDQVKLFDGPLDTNRLAYKINCPVLSMSHTQATDHFKDIILPIGDYLPVNKIRIAVYLAKKFDSSIHLIALEKSGAETDDLTGMKKAFRVLKENTDVPVLCTTIAGQSLSRISVHYAQTVRAGLIVMNSGSGSMLPEPWEDYSYSLQPNGSHPDHGII
jgi:hypothetical protein